MFKALFASALAESAATAAPGASGSLLTSGLLTTALGLGGVFLVLLLFFVIIKAMQKIKDKE